MLFNGNIGNINTMFRVDPTRTMTLRNRFSAKMYNRFRKLKGDIRKSIVDNDVFNLKEKDNFELTTSQALNPNEFIFKRDPEKVALFMDWLQKQIDNGILEVFTGNQLGQAIEEAWSNTYIREAYERGVGRSLSEMSAIGISIPETVSTATAMTMPIHADRVGLLYTRTFTGLKGITDEMSKQISETLADGMARGRGPMEIARNINNRVDKIGITRAKTLARTETIRAHHLGMIQEMKNWRVEGVKVLAEWSTAGDSRVCSICRSLNGKIYSIEKAEGLIPKHPSCVPGDSLISTSNGVSAVSKRWYNGDMLVFKTTGNRIFRCTPNHPILSGNRFVRADSIDVGSNVIAHRGRNRIRNGNRNDINKPTKAEDIAESFFNNSFVFTKKVPTSPPDFHNDGGGSKVSIIGTNSLLLNGVNPTLAKFIFDNEFIFRDVYRVFLNSFSFFTQCFKRSSASFCSSVGSSGLIDSFRSGHLTPFEFFGFALSSTKNTFFPENTRNDISAGTEIFSDSVFGHTPDVKITDFDSKFVKDVVLHKSSIPFSGFVYNFDTPTRYYIMDGIASHNCRCIVLPLDTTDNPQFERQVSERELL